MISPQLSPIHEMDNFVAFLFEWNAFREMLVRSPALLIWRAVASNLRLHPPNRFHREKRSVKRQSKS